MKMYGYVNIRKAVPEDAAAITVLLQQLDYVLPEPVVRVKIERFGNAEEEHLAVYLVDEQVIAFISIHYIPQVAVEGDFARISYFCVDETHRGRKIGERLEKYCVQKAIKRGCDRIELHSHSRRTGAHRFYERLGYVESPKYFVKHLKRK
jgi:GNAT superfamily N-acetyltransferase